jgi:flavodoxin
MDYQVVYVSKSTRQNTKTVAETIASELGTEASRVSPDLKINKCKLLFLGSGVYIYQPSKDMKLFLENLPQMEGQKVAIFITHGGNKENAEKWMKTKLEEKGCTVIGTWDCLGQWAIFVRGHPTNEEINSATEFVKEMIDKVNPNQ